MKKINISESVLNVTVSYYENFTRVDGMELNLLELLLSFADEDQIRSFKVKRLRTFQSDEGRKNEKAEIPCFTPSGTFAKRNTAGLRVHTNLIQFDIDFKDNQHIENYHELKVQLSKINHVAYAGLSVSGKGFWGLIPIKYSDKHKEHFRFIQKAFLSWGIVIDQSGSDVTRLRIVSYDAEPYFNHHAIPLENYDVPELPSLKEVYFTPSDKNLKLIAAIIFLICKHRIDITVGYSNWFTLGCFFATTPNGRNYYHQISRFNKSYDSSQTDRQYNRCLKYSSKITIASFLHICKNYGIIYVPGQMVVWKDDYEMI